MFRVSHRPSIIYLSFPPPSLFLESCKVFISSTPPSLVEPAALHFLVECAHSPGLERWGLESTIEENASVHALEVVKRGALIPANPKVYTEDEAGFELCVKRFRPLLVSIQNLRASFSARLLSALVKFVLSEEVTEECQCEKGDGGESEATPRSQSLPKSNEYTFLRVSTQTAANPSNQHELEHEAGKARKLFFAVRWIEYLLSRDYVSQFHPKAAIFKKSGPNLREKAQGKWRSDEIAFMKEPIYLKEMGYPLNAITDELEAVKESGLGPLGAHLLNIFLVTVAESRQRILKRRHLQPEGKYQLQGPSKARILSPPPKDQRHMSLEEMEAICSTDSEPEVEKATAIPQGHSTTTRHPYPHVLSGDSQHDFEPVKWVKISHFESAHFC